MVIGGFSQGGALAYNIALRHYDEVGGVLVMSSFLPINLNDNSKNILKKFQDGKPLPGPISQHHGDIDPMVQIKSALLGAEHLKKLAKPGEFEFVTYRGLQHSSCPEEMTNADNFINRVLNI